MSERKSDLLVGQAVGDLERTDVGEGHADVLGLAAGVAAVQVRVAEDAGGRCSRHGFSAIQALGLELSQSDQSCVLAEEAAAAGDGERDDDAVAELQVLHVGADFDDLAHELVAEDVAGLHGRDEAVVEVEVGAADRGQRDFARWRRAG